MLGIHPSYHTLSRFADRELGDAKQRRVASHLADCSRCRQEVVFIRRAGNIARSLETPDAPRRLLDEVLRRRDEGERVLLPLESPGAAPSRVRKLAPGVVAILTLFVVGLFFSTRLLQADRAGLEIGPERPRAGEMLAVVYEDDGRFADASELRLEARFRTPAGRRWEQTVATLTRNDEETFATDFVLPDSAVYAGFAVASPDGRRVDSNNQELWQLLVHGPDGRPTLDALAARMAETLGRNPVAAYRTARLSTELYPESPRGWYWRLTVEQSVGSADSLRVDHRQRFRRFEREFADAPPSDPDETVYLAWYAIQLGDRGSAGHWSREAERRDADSAPYYRLQSLLTRLSDLEADSALARLEALWRRAPFPIAAIGDAGVHTALAAGNWSAAMRWLPRLQTARPALDPFWMVDELSRSFEADRVLQWALPELDGGLLEPPPRPIGREMEAHRRVTARVRQRTLAAVAGLAMDAGRSDTASELVARALPLAWETPALETIGAVLATVGDTTSALTAFARAGADPLGAPPPWTREAAGWTRALETARAALSRYVETESVIRYVPDDLETGGPTVVGFVVTCGDVRAADRVAGYTDAPLVLYTPDETPPLTPDGDGHCDADVPVRRDATGSMRTAFRVRGYPTYFVTDAEGRIRFEHSTLSDVPRQVQALRRSSEAVIAD